MKVCFEKDGLLTKCIIKEKNEVFVGYAKCLEEDKDFYSDLIGKEIAFQKATIKHMKYDLKKKREKRKVLLDFYKNNCFHKKFDADSFLARTIWQEICILEKKIEDLKKNIEEFQYSLKKYIEIKDNLHNKIRKMRKEK